MDTAPRLTANSFNKGRDSDTSSDKIMPEWFRQAYNVELIGDNKFFSLQNIAGTTSLTNLATSGALVLGTYKVNWLISGSQKKGLLIFLFESHQLKIIGVDLESNAQYTLFTETQPSDYATEERLVDAVNYSENGVDTVYFSDFFNEIRKVKCEIPASYSANFLTSYDLSLQRKGANGIIKLNGNETTAITTGGSLLSGTYQFVYRMCDPINKRFTKWSTPSFPVHVYSTTVSTAPTYAGVGLATDKKIKLTLTPSYSELNYQYVQAAVIENVGATPAISASLLEITAYAGTSQNFEYKSNAKVGTVPIDQIVVDLAAIKTSKTLRVKENRLVAGNVKYASFTDGSPTIASGSIITQYSALDRDMCSNPYFNSNYLGYFRDETYRFGVVYYDENGNKSQAFPLNFNGKVSGNQITSGLPDIKFPGRDVNPFYSIFSTTGAIQTLGLQINGLTGHPTTACGLEIVRVKRKKNILFQTPLVPMAKIEGVGAVSNYPSRYYKNGNYVTVTDVQPMTSTFTLVPKNLFWPEFRDIVRRRFPLGSSSIFSPAPLADGNEVILSQSNAFTHAALFPNSPMYGDTPFEFTGSEKIDYVDYALLKATINSFTDNSTGLLVDGNTVTTNITGTFHALSDGQYYFDSTTGRSPLSSSLKDLPVRDFKFFDNYSQTTTVGGSSALDYDALQTQGLNFWQNKPTVSRMGVAQIGGFTSLNPVETIPFKSGTINSPFSSSYIIGSSGITYETANTLSNNYFNKYSGFSNGNSYISYLPIVNIKLGLGDDRYGDISSQLEFIGTGAKYTFSQSERATIAAGGSVSVDIQVWGGDCFVGPHLFKISDSAYSVTNQEKNQTPVGTGYDDPDKQAGLWGLTYRYNDVYPMCLPVAVENAGQYVQVVLESEYNGEVRDIDGISSNSNESGIPLFTNTSKDSIRTPLTYKYNINLSRGNYQKIYEPKAQYSFVQNDFESRLIYSDLKLYNSSEAGFDIFRVANFYDLEESRGRINKLALSGDNLYSIQEKGIALIRTGQTTLEAGNGQLITIGSGDFINKPLIVDAFRGSQHPKGIVETGQFVYVPDNLNKSVYILAGDQLKPIIDNNETEFRTFFGNKIAENNVIASYNFARKELLLANTSTGTTQVFIEGIGWTGVYEFTNLKGLTSDHWIGSPSSNLTLYSAYSGTPNQIFGITVQPRVTFIVNPEGNFPKVYTNQSINSDGQLGEITHTTPTQTSTTSLAIPPTEDRYRIQIGVDNGRLRSTNMQCTLVWGSSRVALKDVFTKYRLSARTL
jgi:hypothetical protein